MAEKNDYCQYYVDTGQVWPPSNALQHMPHLRVHNPGHISFLQYPSNFVRDPPAAQRYVQDAPKMQQLVTVSLRSVNPQHQALTNQPTNQPTNRATYS